MPLRRPLLLLALVALSSGRVLLSGTEVRVSGGRVIVQATSVPLTEVLNRFSQATGTKIVYDAGKPRQLVSVEIDAASPAEALAQLLEGQGLSYALRLDPSGRAVEMLFLMSKGQAAASAPSAASSAVGRRGTYDAIEEPPAEMEASVPEPQEPAGGEVFPDPLLDPTAAQPPPGVVPGAPTPGSGIPLPGGLTPYSTPWQPAGPSFPQAASYPSWR